MALTQPFRPCFSLRASLIDQGVTTEDALRTHLEYVYAQERVDPSFPVRNYKVDADVPNRVPPNRYTVN